MNTSIVGLIAFICTFAGAMFGMWLRTVLPEHHLSTESGDSIKVGIGLIATMTALVLGLVTASAKNTFDTIDQTVRNTAIDILTLDRLLARYGSETADIRTSLQQVIAKRVETIWPEDTSRSGQVDPSASMTEGEQIVERIRALTPHDAIQRGLQPRAAELGETLLKTRWMIGTPARMAVPLPFLVILLFWLTMIFTSFGLFAPKNLTVLAVLFVCSISVCGALFLILELDGPFDGLIKVSPDPVRYAISRINK